MNIAEAKKQLIYAAEAYFAVDGDGISRIVSRQQRPVLLMGPPGIGKTAIVEQTAGELGVSFLSYSMTHHTRQSALGLPVILEREFDGKNYRVSEYTMSEIIASVYEIMEKTGLRRGILFLDEINCVSETLTPVMLQFLQYKVFGKHALPEGWMVVLAGNPPEYNRNAKEFDIVTLDRLKVIEIEPDYAAWRAYAASEDTHPAVLTFLDGHRERFYDVKTTEEGRIFVTARGWSDLAAMLSVCEAERIPVSRELITQYIRYPAAAEEFASFYDLYAKYRSDYRTEAILSGTEPEEIRQRAAAAPFDERWSVLGILLRKVRKRIREAVLAEDVCRALHGILSEVKELPGLPGRKNLPGMSRAEGITGLSGRKDLPGMSGAEGITGLSGRKGSVEETGCAQGENVLQKELLRRADEAAGRLERDRLRGVMTPRSEKTDRRVIAFLKENASCGGGFEAVKGKYALLVSEMKEQIRQASCALENLFQFAERVWPDGTELLTIVTELTAGEDSARFIAKHGSEGYERNSARLRFGERRDRILREIGELEEEDF